MFDIDECSCKQHHNVEVEKTLSYKLGVGDYGNINRFLRSFIMFKITSLNSHPCVNEVLI